MGASSYLLDKLPSCHQGVLRATTIYLMMHWHFAGWYDILGSKYYSRVAERKMHRTKDNTVRYGPRLGAKPRVWHFPGDILGALETQWQRWLSAILRPSYTSCRSKWVDMLLNQRHKDGSSALYHVCICDIQKTRSSCRWWRTACSLLSAWF